MLRLYVADEVATLLNRLLDEEMKRARSANPDIKSDDRKTWPEAYKKLDRAKRSIADSRQWQRASRR